MATASSKWTKLGSNEVSPPAVGQIVDISKTATGASGIDAQVRHEMLLWMDTTAAQYTKPFDWAVTGDFTIMLNGTANAITADAGNVTVAVEGSLDNSNYITMQTITSTWNAGGASETDLPGVAIYDFDTYGVMPYMRIAITPGGDADCETVASNVKINVFMHNG